MLTILVIGSLIALILIGVPIAVSLGVVAAGTFILLGQEFILTMLAQRMYASTTAFTLLAIPFFILAGLLMNQGGITERIFRFASAVVGHITGGLGQVNVIASLIFSGMSGAAVADAAGLGQVELKAMNDRGYAPKFSAAITAASSTIGPVFPPSIPFVIYSSITGVSVIKLFLAGVVPGLLMAIALMAAVYFVSRRRRYPTETRASLVELWSSFKGALLSLGTPVIIVGGILGGFFTPTEAGVAASIYAGILAILVYRELTWREIPALLWETLRHTIRVMFVIATAGFFGWLLIHQRIPDQIIVGLTELAGNKAVVLVIIVAILLVLGMFLEGIAVIVLTVPLFLPLVIKFGVDPIQFGVIMIMASMLGLLTPPVGMVLYSVASISKIRIGALAKELTPYLIGIFLVLILVTYVPQISTWFPELVLRK